MKLDQLKKYKKILILGYGKEGQATEKFLKSLSQCLRLVLLIKINANYLVEQKNMTL